MIMALTNNIKWINARVALSKLQPWSENPRYSTKAQAKRLLDSWADLGQFQTIAVGPDFEVYDGHQRLSALLTMYDSAYEVDVRQAHRPLTNTERKRLSIVAHTGSVGAWDWEKLVAWDSTELGAWGMDSEALVQWNTDATVLQQIVRQQVGSGSGLEGLTVNDNLGFDRGFEGDIESRLQNEAQNPGLYARTIVLIYPSFMYGYIVSALEAACKDSACDTYSDFIGKSLLGDEYERIKSSGPSV